MELELYNQQSEGADTTALRQKVELLRYEVIRGCFIISSPSWPVIFLDTVTYYLF